MKVKNTLYYQVMLELRKKIDDGEYPANSKLPTEKELQKLFGVSRVTLRQAINYLSDEGVIEKIQGNGSYVRNPPKVKKMLKFNTLEGFSTTAKKNGFFPSYKIIEFQDIIPSRRLQRIFEIKSAAHLNIKRILFLDGQPAIVDDSYIPTPFSQGLTEENVRDSLYGALKEKSEAKQLFPKETFVGAIEADKELSDLLEKPFGCALLDVTNTLVNEKGETIQYSEEYVDPEIYQIKIR
ncbi:GntR family transcriptional regulator [Ligilactobacillus pobuzihii]|uniref:Transcriptional regulator, gntr family n=1 Tax=Ligilactobacillus pobuzihii TaxID=449659 RepID=A0A0R2LHW3_9LACO|nr:GntR family transcriptional regulator [Ligilactobacillus pobuzihii]KRO01305.1 transcriptional regulator, gntr family [Ligilactobacillus pobuzihii]GEN48892.1 GntR family transcriptional regulator [Ligilactobacillus pobuzihii]